MATVPTFKNSDFAALRKAAGLYYHNEIEKYTKFSRFGCVDPWNPVLNTREYLFFTKPDLHLFNDSTGSQINYQIKNAPFFTDAFSRYIDVFKSLQISLQSSTTPFITLLSHHVNSNLELPSIVAEVSETSATVYGTSLQYQVPSITSDQDFDFSLEFKDNTELECYMLFKIWHEYRNNKDRISPPNSLYYVLNKILHDQISVYKFIVADDAKTIIYYAKLYGVFPKSVPRDSFGNLDAAGGLSYSVNFHAQFVDDMNPMILVDFNNLVDKYFKSNAEIPIYDSDHSCINGQWCNSAYVKFVQPQRSKIGHYELVWR